MLKLDKGSDPFFSSLLSGPGDRRAKTPSPSGLSQGLFRGSRIADQALESKFAGEPADKRGKNAPINLSRKYLPVFLPLQRDPEKANTADAKQHHPGAQKSGRQPDKPFSRGAFNRHDRLGAHAGLSIVTAVEADNGLIVLHLGGTLRT